MASVEFVNAVIGLLQSDLYPRYVMVIIYELCVKILPTRWDKTVRNFGKYLEFAGMATFVKKGIATIELDAF